MDAQQLLSEIYQAIDDDEALARLSDNVAEMCGARSANIVYSNSADEFFQQMSYFPASYVPIYLEHFVDKDPWRRHAQELGQRGRAISMDSYVPPERFVETEFYNELLKPLGDDTGRCMGIEAASPAGMLHIAVHRPLSGSEFSRSDLLRFEDAFLHVARVLKTRSLLSRERSCRVPLEQMIDATGSALLIVDDALNIIASSRAAELCMSSDDGIACRSGKLHIVDDKAARSCREAVRSTMARSTSSEMALLCPRRSGKAHYRLIVLPAGRMAGAAIIIDDPGSPSRECRRASFSRAYGLTESEQQLTELLMRGLTLKDIADARQVSFETIRTQLKSVFAKTGTNRQADLIRILS